MIAVVGSWHQATVLAAGFAAAGQEVRQVVTDAAALAGLRAGRAPVVEPGLDELIAEGRRAGRLEFTGDCAEAVPGATHVLLAIDTPVGANDESDLSSIVSAAEAIAGAATGPFVLCVSAQVPIGTCDEIERIMRSRPDLPIDVVYVPEFLRLGTALETFREADRFVIGTDDGAAFERAAALYRPLGRPLLQTRRRSAEMAKHASNAFLATSISFINQVADLCEVTGADVNEVAQVLKLDRRIGPHAFLSAGMGYAGGTLGREITALRAIGDREHVDTGFLAAVDAVNRARVPAVLVRLRRELGEIRGRRVAVLGLAYKSGTSTLRRSASLELVSLLRSEGAAVVAFDPLARLDEVEGASDVDLRRDPVDAARGADAAVVAAPWPGLTALDLAALRAALAQPLLVDAANAVAPERARAAGLRYVGVGR